MLFPFELSSCECYCLPAPECLCPLLGSEPTLQGNLPQGTGSQGKCSRPWTKLAPWWLSKPCLPLPSHWQSWLSTWMLEIRATGGWSILTFMAAKQPKPSTWWSLIHRWGGLKPRKRIECWWQQLICMSRGWNASLGLIFAFGYPLFENLLSFAWSQLQEEGEPYRISGWSGSNLQGVLSPGTAEVKCWILWSSLGLQSRPGQYPTRSGLEHLWEMQRLKEHYCLKGPEKPVSLHRWKTWGPTRM